MIAQISPRKREKERRRCRRAPFSAKTPSNSYSVLIPTNEKDLLSHIHIHFSLIMSESMKEFIHCTDPRSLHKAAHFEAFVYRHCSPCCVCHEFHSVTKGRYLTTHNSSQPIDGTTRHSYYYFNDDQRRP